VPASLTNVKRIITSANLVALEGIPNDVLFTIPFETFIPGPSKGDQYRAYGWLKKVPTIRAGARRKSSIEQEWVYGLYSTLLYGPPI
jgi:hypothetical protein